jgi:hypothetical protein
MPTIVVRRCQDWDAAMIHHKTFLVQINYELVFLVQDICLILESNWFNILM